MDKSAGLGERLLNFDFVLGGNLSLGTLICGKIYK